MSNHCRCTHTHTHTQNTHTRTKHTSTHTKESTSFSPWPLCFCLIHCSMGGRQKHVRSIGSHVAQLRYQMWLPTPQDSDDSMRAPMALANTKATRQYACQHKHTCSIGIRSRSVVSGASDGEGFHGFSLMVFSGWNSHASGWADIMRTCKCGSAASLVCPAAVC